MANASSSVPATSSRPSSTTSYAASGRPAQSSTSAAVSRTSRSQATGALSDLDHQARLLAVLPRRGQVAAGHRDPGGRAEHGGGLDAPRVAGESLVDQLARLGVAARLHQLLAHVVQQQAALLPLLPDAGQLDDADPGQLHRIAEQPGHAEEVAEVDVGRSQVLRVLALPGDGECLAEQGNALVEPPAQRGDAALGVERQTLLAAGPDRARDPQRRGGRLLGLVEPGPADGQQGQPRLDASGEHAGLVRRKQVERVLERPVGGVAAAPAEQDPAGARRGCGAHGVRRSRSRGRARAEGGPRRSRWPGRRPRRRAGSARRRRARAAPARPGRGRSGTPPRRR